MDDADAILVDQPASPPIREIYTWIGHYADGGEGMLSADFPTPGGLGGVRHMPLLNSRREVAETMAPLARRIQSASQHAVSRITKIELRTFKAASDG
jgi:hypothetical protein